MMKSWVFPGRLLILGVVGLVWLWGGALESGDSPAGLGEDAAVFSIAGGGATVSEPRSRQTIHVDDDAPNDPGPGDPTVSDPAEDGSAGHPFDAVQEGIDAAVNGDEVLLADGSYTGVGNRNLDFGGRLITVRSENGADTCIIDCQSAGRGFYFHSGEDETAVVEGLTITNGYVTGDGGGIYCDGSSPTLRDCTLTGNTAGDDGGGLYSYDGDPTLTSCTFDGNTADSQGGGVYCDGNSPTLLCCTFTGNTASYYGGGLTNRDGNPTLTSCTFSGNDASDGGGLYNDSGNPTLASCIFSGNTARDDGGGMCNQGGDPNLTFCTFTGNTASDRGGGLSNYYGDPTLTSCAFSGNTAEYGGGIYNYRGGPTLTDCAFSGNDADHGGGVYNSWGTDASLTRCTFTANDASGNGGGTYSDASHLSLTDCTFTANNANGDGGGVYSFAGHVSLAHCMFATNTAEGYGGGTYHTNGDSILSANCTFAGNSAIGGGGIVIRSSTAVTLVNCVLTGNSASASGGAVYIKVSDFDVANSSFGCNAAQSGGGVYQEGGSVALANCVLWGNSDAGGQDESAQYDGGSPNVNYSCVQGWTGALGGLGNIGADPLFVDPDGPDDIAGTEDDDLRLAPGSPCTDAGDNAAIPLDTADLDGDGITGEFTPLDLDGGARRYDDPLTTDTGNPDPVGPPVVDMGAYEFPSDCNGNGVSDAAEIAQGTSEDCNDNNIPDECDIADGMSSDFNANGVPDDCEGACCTEEDCAETNEVDCLAGGGGWVAGTVCPPGNPVNPCGPGTCCTCPGICTPDLLQADCLALGGSLTPTGTCDPNPCPEAPPNDDCANAVVISGLTAVPVLVDFDNRCATDDGPVTSCAADGRDLHFDAWFVYTAEFSADLTVSLCDTVAWDSMIAVYDGGTPTCPPTSDDELACDNDGCGLDDGASEVQLSVEAGEEVLIRVGGRFNPETEEGNARGEGTVRFAITPKPPVAPWLYPDYARKNRALSFIPNNPGAEVAFRVELTAVGPAVCYDFDPTGDVGTTWWATAPVCTDLYGHDTGAVPGLDLCEEPNVWRSQLTLDSQEPFVWPDECVHLFDCEVIPMARYEIRTVDPGIGSPSVPLIVETIEKPGTKCWADVAGGWKGTMWTPPNQSVDFDDVQAAVFLFTDHRNKPPRTWVELGDEGPDMVLNFTDIQMIIEGFKGHAYPYPNPSSCP